VPSAGLPGAQGDEVTEPPPVTLVCCGVIGTTVCDNGMVEFGPDSQSGLSDRTGIYRSDLVATINDLTARGLVVRAPDPADRRRNAITLTDAGRRHLKRLDALIAEGQAEFLAPLSPADRAELTRLLKLLVAHHSNPDHA